MSKFVLGLLMAGLAVALAACGGPAPTPTGPVTVEVTLSEFSIDFSLTTFQVGTTYSFEITNAGTLAHEFLLEAAGSVDEPLESADGQEAEVEEEDLGPGASATFEWTFDTAGDFQIACHVPGHYEAGMVTPITLQ